MQDNSVNDVKHEVHYNISCRALFTFRVLIHFKGFLQSNAFLKYYSWTSDHYNL